MTKNCSQGGFSVQFSPLISVRLCREPGAGPCCLFFFFLFAYRQQQCSSSSTSALKQPVLQRLQQLISVEPFPALHSSVGWQWASQQFLQRIWGQIGKENLFAAQMYADIKSNATDGWWQQLGGRRAGQAGVPVESLCACTERQACWHTGLPGLSLQWDL